MVLTEVKCAGEALIQRLTSIDNQLTWVVFAHCQGAGGVACSLKSNWANQIRATHIDSQNQWVAIELASFVLIGMYANSPQAYRGRIWDLLVKKFDNPILLIGDLNMVEFSEDKYMKRGQTVSSTKKLPWVAYKNHFNLADIGTTRQFTWKNYGVGDLQRKAWIDRCYISKELSANFFNLAC